MNKEELDELEKRWLATPEGEWTIKQFSCLGAHEFLVRSPGGVHNKEFEIMAQFFLFGNVDDRKTLAGSKKDILSLISYIRELESKIK